MAIDNYDIAEQFSLLSKLMDIHGENSFKVKSYSIAAFTIEKLPKQLTEMQAAEIFSVKGIGDAIGKKILTIVETGELPLLNEFIQKTPPGVIEMLRIKGLGPKKIATIWKEMEIESIGELLYACQENRLLLYKGFGEKTQKAVHDTIEFFLKNQGSWLYSEAEAIAQALTQKLSLAIPDEKWAITGDFRRQLEIVEKLEWVTTAKASDLKELWIEEDFSIEEDGIERIAFKSPEKLRLVFYPTNLENFYSVLFERSASPEFMESWKKKTGWDHQLEYLTEESIFEQFKINFIPAFERETAVIIEKAAAAPLAQTIQISDILSIIHSHSRWSDGSQTLEEMADACIEQGFEYLVISDHSKSAFYANGLNEERIGEQHRQIDELNERLRPFRIFKSIECDILSDGQLDYSNKILATFDLVIASIHSNLKMTEEKAMNRLLKAIENPYTRILGHMTGRLLLSRPGYPVNYEKIIDACAANQVVIELNAHPRRLDMDWRWIGKALEKGVLISIDPDAHSIEGFKDIRYGVLSAQKAGLTKFQNLSSFNLDEFERFLKSKN
jgi:DNA polymerase (family 10)